MNNDKKTQHRVGLNQFYSKIYAFLTFGIGISALVCHFLFTVFWKELFLLIDNPMLNIGFLVIEALFILFLLKKMHETLPLILTGIVVFSILNGINLTVFFMFALNTSIFIPFLATGLTFGMMSLSGLFIKKELSGITRLLLTMFIGVIFSILFTLVIFHPPTLTLIVSISMILMFSGIILYENHQTNLSYLKTKGHATHTAASSIGLHVYSEPIKLFLRILGESEADTFP